jgi:hypothetical protein
MDLIDQLEIADGLKQLLLSKDFTLKSLLSASSSDLAKILGIDEYVAKILSSAIKQSMATKDLNHNSMTKQHLSQGKLNKTESKLSNKKLMNGRHNY